MSEGNGLKNESFPLPITPFSYTAHLADCDPFSDDQLYFVAGPRFPTGDFTSEEYRERQNWEKQREREHKFRQLLDTLASVFSSAADIDDLVEAERKMGNLEEGVQRLIEDE